jgi:hypothetical protein
MSQDEGDITKNSEDKARSAQIIPQNEEKR